MSRHQLRFDEAGRDEGSACTYRVSVTTAAVVPDMYYPNYGGLQLHYSYRFEILDHESVESRYEVEFSGQISERHKEALAEFLDARGVPLPARNDTLHVIFALYGGGNPPGFVDHIEARVVIRVQNYVPPDRDLEFEIDENVFLDLDEDELDRVRETSIADFLGPTPASVEAVDALEKVPISEIKESCCAVCLEGFVFGSEATKMPCSHAFHGDCIVRWLEHRCFCPLCRFELPSTS